MKSARPTSAAAWTGGRTLSDPQISPDERFVAFVTASADRAELGLIDVDGGNERWLPLQPAIRRGGGSYGWLPDGSGMIYLGADGCVHSHHIASGASRSLTRWPDALSALQVSPDGTMVAYVVDTQHIAVVDTNGRDQWPRRLSSDADFAFDPVWSADSRRVAWHEWDVPNMPWDGGRIVVRSADGSTPIITVAGDDEVSVQQPRFSPDGRYLSFLSDIDGWLNIWVVDAETLDGARPLVSEEFEHAPPAWGPGQRSYCWTRDGESVVFVRNDRSEGRLCVHEVRSETTRVLVDDATFSALTAGVNTVVGTASGPLRALTVQAVDLSSGGEHTLVRGPFVGVERAGVKPEHVEWEDDDGASVHGRLYRSPSRPAGPAPMIVWIHGGPAGQSPATLYARWGYFLERGWSVLVVDYRGSTGWGRSYAQALRGRWAEIDVSDVAAGVRVAVERGWADPDLIVAFGGSSAGTTALRLLSDHGHLFAAAIALYPLVDFLDFEEETWRFEAHYMERLIGPLPDAHDRYFARSPLHSVDSIDKPVLLLHGEDDKVVPVGHTLAISERLSRAGRVVEHHIYEGEGHGWRSNRTQADELERIEAFLRRHVLRGTPKRTP